MKWRYQTESVVISSPAIATDGTVYVGSDDNYLYAFNVDGSLKWRYQTGDKVSSRPAIGAGAVDDGLGHFVWLSQGSGDSVYQEERRTL